MIAGRGQVAQRVLLRYHLAHAIIRERRAVAKGVQAQRCLSRSVVDRPGTIAARGPLRVLGSWAVWCLYRLLHEESVRTRPSHLCGRRR